MNIVWNNLIHGQRWKVEVEGLEKEIFLLLFYLCSQHAIMPKNKRSRSGEKKSMGIKSNIPYLCFMLLLCLVFNLSILSYTLFCGRFCCLLSHVRATKGRETKEEINWGILMVLVLTNIYLQAPRCCSFLIICVCLVLLGRERASISTPH